MTREQSSIDSESVRQTVREGYRRIAVTGNGCCGSRVSSCGPSPVEAEQLARHVGYSADELAALPDGANLGLSCGNPAALAALKPGETVLTLAQAVASTSSLRGAKSARPAVPSVWT